MSAHLFVGAGHVQTLLVALQVGDDAAVVVAGFAEPIEVCWLEGFEAAGHEVDDAHAELVLHDCGEIEHADLAGGGFEGELIEEGTGGDANFTGDIGISSICARIGGESSGAQSKG